VHDVGVREPRYLEAAFKHAVRLEAYEKAVDDKREQYKMRDNRGRRYDALARKVIQLEKEVERDKGTESAARIRSATDESVKELRQTMARSAKQNEELSKEVGRFCLLEEQRAKVSALLPAAPQVQLRSPRLFVRNGSALTAMFQATSPESARRRNGRNAVALTGS